MAVTPLGNTIFINQNVNMVSSKVADVQNRFDLQNLAAASLASDEKQEVSEVRPTEETYKIDPENEHEKQKGRQEQGELASKQNKREQALFGFFGDVEAADEGLEGGGRDAVLAAGEGFELLVGLRHGVAAHHGLDGLGQELPGGIEVGLHGGGIGFEFVQAAQVGGPAEQGVAGAHAHIAQVALSKSF